LYSRSGLTGTGGAYRKARNRAPAAPSDRHLDAHRAGIKPAQWRRSAPGPKNNVKPVPEPQSTGVGDPTPGARAQVVMRLPIPEQEQRPSLGAAAWGAGVRVWKTSVVIAKFG